MGKFAEYLDDATEQNIKTIGNVSGKTSMLEKVAKKHSQISKIHGDDLMMEDHQ